MISSTPLGERLAPSETGRVTNRAMEMYAVIPGNKTLTDVMLDPDLVGVVSGSNRAEALRKLTPDYPAIKNLSARQLTELSSGQSINLGTKGKLVLVPRGMGAEDSNALDSMDLSETYNVGGTDGVFASIFDDAEQSRVQHPEIKALVYVVDDKWHVTRESVNSINSWEIKHGELSKKDRDELRNTGSVTVRGKTIVYIDQPVVLKIANETRNVDTRRDAIIAWRDLMADKSLNIFEQSSDTPGEPQYSTWWEEQPRSRQNPKRVLSRFVKALKKRKGDTFNFKIGKYTYTIKPRD